ncbi:MAG: 6-phosphogluconolactonase [Porphyrobacter sp.]|nr:6-phosphogluconolactonase [Porphyrobacter sp.]
MADIMIIEGASDAAIADWLEQALVRLWARREDESDWDIGIAVPGGSTPFPIIEQLMARHTGFDPDFDFSRLFVYPTDDRIVPETHEASNTGKIRALFEPKGAGIRPLADLETVPELDLVWLGMGDDGHIASLFPNTDPQVDDPQAVRVLTPDPLPPHAPFDRITLTLPSLLNTRELLFVIRGDDKRAVFNAAMRGEHDLPIARLLGAARARGIPVTVFV